MTPPVALFVFNRPELTERVFAAVAKVKPSQLLVVADGPRPGHPSDEDRCARTRAIIEHVDWPCDVQTNYAATNLGCRDRVASGLDWVFSTVEEAIILEDDCVPDPSFFPFCAELLDRYRHDTRVGHIGGVNFLFDTTKMPYSYDFVRTPNIWGWASWRRAWQYYDMHMPLWHVLRDEHRLTDVFEKQPSPTEYRILDDLATGKTTHTWDHQWMVTCHAQHMLSILPAVNLVTNIGFGAEATHTFGRNRTADVATIPMAFPLRHPPYMVPNKAVETAMRKQSQSSLPLRIGEKVLPRPIKRLMRQQYQQFVRRTRSPLTELPAR